MSTANSAWAPFRHRAFAVLWIATVVSNIGTWMHDVASGWLMATLTTSPIMVSLVQAATTAPVFLFALAAGTMADLVDRRRLLLVVMGCLAVSTLALAVLVFLGRVGPLVLLAFTFLSGIGAAFAAPAWQSIVPQLVPRADLASAVAVNSVGVNISRAIGPALAGSIIAGAGIAWPYVLNALSFTIVIAALLWWRPPAKPPSHLPAERFGSALRSGLRFAGSSGAMRATLARAVAFFLFASAYWALLPLLARQVLQGGPELYGFLLGAVGIGAVGGALLLPRLRRRYDAGTVVNAGSAGTALVLLTFGLVPVAEIAMAASLLAGVCWIAVLASLNVSAQLALPDWMRARGLAIFITVFFGSMTLGSVVWGMAASMLGIPAALVIAACGALAAVVLVRDRTLQEGAGLDLSPSSHWPEPLVADTLPIDRGPVLVTIEYRVAPTRIDAFLAAMSERRVERHRGGAYGWGLFEDAAMPGRWLEVFTEASWLAHLRHHERVAEPDRLIRDRLQECLVPGCDPVITHLLAPLEGRPTGR